MPSSCQAAATQTPSRVRGTLLLPIAIPLLILFLVQGLLYTQANAFASKYSQALKAPNNADGFVINLPNSRKNEYRLETQIQFLGESLVQTMGRHLAGDLRFFPHAAGTQVESPSRDGRLLLVAQDGKNVVKLLLPSVFDGGGVAEIEFTGRVGGGNTKTNATKLPMVIYSILSTSVLMIDVPGLLAACQKGGFTIVNTKFYALLQPNAAPIQVRLQVDLGQQLVHLLF